MLATAPAALASCSRAQWDARVCFGLTCSSTNCQVAFKICNTGWCPTAIPAGTQFTVSLTNNSTIGDSIQKASAGGYTYVSSSTGAPRDGVTATLAGGSTWTYVLSTSAQIPNGSCTQFTFNQVDTGRNYTLRISLIGVDGNRGNNSLTWTGTLAATASDVCATVPPPP